MRNLSDPEYIAKLLEGWRVMNSRYIEVQRGLRPKYKRRLSLQMTSGGFQPILRTLFRPTTLLVPRRSDNYRIRSGSTKQVYNCVKLFFSFVTLGLFSFFLWSALKPSKPQTGIFLKQPRTTKQSLESMDDPKLPPLRDPWDRKWQI